MEDKAGLIVRSVAGRDTGELFIILRVEGDYAYIANGDLRKVDSPKKKKLRHLKSEGQYSEFIKNKLMNTGKVTNNEVRIAIAEYQG